MWIKNILPLLLFLPTFRVYAQGTNQSQAKAPDVLVSKSGERLIGKLVSANDASVVFESEAAGRVTVAWSKVQELHTSSNFAVLRKGTQLRHRQDANTVPQGTVSVADQRVQVSPATQGAPQPQPVALPDVSNIVEQSAFNAAFQRHGLFQRWAGGATAGIAYTSSTQKSQSYTAALNLTRAVPGETWTDNRSRTILGFTEAYGEISEAGTPTTKTSITHFGLEQDWYLKPRLFAFAQVLLDHNFSLGLNLQQDYGGGLGFVLIKSARQELDVKASVDYIHQQYAISSHNQSLIGTTFGERYTYKFRNGILFTESGDYIPAWNNTSFYSAVANAALTFPVYHHFGFTIGGIDNYLNSPPIGFKKNSFTLTMGLTYSLQ
ncbi:MAG: DUF481 domain-containing protein [Blastocatellia bacterium]|nr:DUF481 domain-containing protein [Blastocatellia bacterium]